jgi:hypothetical protein
MEGPRICCNFFREATEGGSDNDAAGALIVLDEKTGRWGMGTNLPPLAWCPWCSCLLAS